MNKIKLMGGDISQIRREYAGRYLNENQVGIDPIKFFKVWFDEAVRSEVLDANAMTLSTVDVDGRPQGRIVLIKGVDKGKFIFYTNYDSKKSKDLIANPHASFTFYYKELNRQIRIDGPVTKCSDAVSDEYFSTRPIKSRIGAWISNQSSVIPSRFYLIRKFAEYSLKNVGRTIIRPTNWGGFELKPEHFEFWQGRPNRLHDRIEFILKDGKWSSRRLAP